jgi:mono/diheme cytochrome c family protein
MIKLKTFLSASLALGTIAGGTAALAESTIQSGVYTDPQAERGKAVYEQHCQACHVPAFFEAKFQAWSNQPLIALYDTVSFSMPESNPGGLALQEYTDVMAYILSMLGYPSGDQELSHTDGSMDSIVIKTE